MDQLSPLIGVKQACHVLAVPRATWDRRRRCRLSPVPVVPGSEKRQRHSARALSESEQSAVLGCLHEERFQDGSPAQVYAALLDEGRFPCSIRTLYRRLQARGENGERRDPLTHPPYPKPELLATAANPLWSWDSTKLRGPGKWTFYPLYVILDVFSRFVVGWMIAYRESAELAKRFDRAHLPQAEHRPRPAHRPRRSRLVDEIQTGGAVAGGSGSAEDPQPAPCLR
jgi:putative transposase